jgi:hypothetical protein
VVTAGSGRGLTQQPEINQPAGTHEEERDDAAVQQTKVWLFGMVRRNKRRFHIIAALSMHSERNCTHDARLSKPRASRPVSYKNRAASAGRPGGDAFPGMDRKEIATKRHKKHRNANIFEPFVLFFGRYVLAVLFSMLRTDPYVPGSLEN